MEPQFIHTVEMKASNLKIKCRIELSETEESVEIRLFMDSEPFGLRNCKRDELRVALEALSNCCLVAAKYFGLFSTKTICKFGQALKESLQSGLEEIDPATKLHLRALSMKEVNDARENRFATLGHVESGARERRRAEAERRALNGPNPREEDLTHFFEEETIVTIPSDGEEDREVSR